MEVVIKNNYFGVETMEGRTGLLFLVVLGAAWACDSKELTNSGTSELSIKPDVCALCEEYITKALDYLHENKTETEIINILHNTCHQLPSFMQKCVALVDFYAPLFFSEVATIQPGEFCHKVNLCQNIAYIGLKVQDDSCEFCQDTVSTLLEKLKETDTKGRMGLLFLVVLGAAWACDARELANPDLLSKLSRKPDACALCEEYSTKVLDYLNENKTQQEIIDILLNTCHQTSSFKQKCITLVDYYAPLFFLEIVTIQPGEFCHKVNLCQLVTYISLLVQEDTSGFCKVTVSTLLAKLKDSDTKLEIIETSLKVCNSVEKYANKCKRMVLEYGPLVFDNAEKFLESTDIWAAIYAMQIFNSGWPANLSFRFLWKQRSNRFVVYLLQKIAIYITTQ
ncbi:Prosaposin [Glycine max]|nr:Prosaposin [Glycine max]KAH1194341.1 Prosaposin [Glycine max]